MTAIHDDPSRSLSNSLRAALAAGIVCGAAFGLLDALIASRIGTAQLDIASFLGCTAAAVFEYVAAWVVALFAAAVVLRPFRGRREAATQALDFVHIALLIGIFVELYWWSRPYLFPGWNSLSPARLATTLGIALVSILIAFVLARPVDRLIQGSKRWLVASVLVVAAVGGIYMVLQGGSIGSRGDKNERNARVPNVLLVVVDALRQDTLGCYGHPRVKSPNIDRLAAEGVVFENAFTQAPFTLTSFGSFLTGKYPRRHGLVSMAPNKRMRRDNVTLPKHLKQACFLDAGHACFESSDWLNASFHTGAISNGSGLLRGFDIYYEQMLGHGIVIADSVWSVFRSDLLLHVIADKARTKVKSGVPGVSRAWLEEVGDHRFMAMVHLYSTHTPYDPPREFRDAYVDPRYAGPFKSFYAADRLSIEDGVRVPDDADFAQIRNLYYGGVSQADADIGKLVETLRARGVLDDTLVIVLSDHGESLGESGLGFEALLEHDHMVQSNLRIPLVMRWPRNIAAGTRVRALVDEIDLLPTICELLGLNTPPQRDEDSKVDGRSLVPLLTRTKDSVREYSFAENGPFMSVQDLRWKLVVPAAFVEKETWTPISSGSPYEVPWLVDLAADPAESRNVLADHPDVFERLSKALREYDKSMPIPKSDEITSDREIARQAQRIKELGYAGTEGTERHGIPPKKNP